MNDNLLDDRLSDALNSAVTTMPTSNPPTFTWQKDTPSSNRPRRNTRRWVGVSAVGLVAAAVTAVTLAATIFGSPSSQQGSSHAAPPVSIRSHVAQSVARGVQRPDSAHAAPKLLLAAARTRLRTGDPVLAAGQYRYVRILGPAAGQYVTDAAGKWQYVPAPAGSYSLDEYWIPKNESDLWMRRSSAHGSSDDTPTTWTGKCGDLYADTQDGPKGDPCTRPGSFKDPTPAFIAGLPRDPDALYRDLHASAEQNLNPDKIHDVGYEMFFTIDDLLDSGYLTSDVTSTFYTVLSRIPGITVLDGTQNYSGVTGTGFRLSTTFGHGPDSVPNTSTIIVDLNTGTYLGDREVIPGRQFSSAVTVGVANHLGVPGH